MRLHGGHEWSRLRLHLHGGALSLRGLQCGCRGGTTNADAGVGIGLLKGGFKNLIEKVINSPIRPLITRKQYQLAENNINNDSKVLINQFKPIIN